MKRRNPILQHAVATTLSLAMFASGLAQAQDAAEEQLAEVVVTGSRIRGAAPVGSALVGIERADIEAASGLTVDRIIKELPQVFDLGVSENSRGQSGGAGNIVWGNTINLRGIGPYATLVLVDGHRVVNNSRSVDPSVIPTLGLERIEIVADGASAVYGSDAVAGVVNLVPRRNLDGVDTALRYGSGDRFDEYQAGIAYGALWDGGQAMVAYEHSFRSNLSGDDRSFFTGDFRPQGASDTRTTQCDPGTINAAGTTYAIPAAGVTPATAATLIPGTVNRCNLGAGQDLLPEQTYNSFNATFTQRFNDWLELFADGFYSKRDFERQPAYTTASRQNVPVTNAFYVQPPGAPLATYSVDYSFIRDLPRDTQTGWAESWEVTPGLRFSMPLDLRAEVLFTYGKNEDMSITRRGLNATALGAALASNNAATAFDPYGLHRTSPAVLAAISDQIFIAPTLNDFRGMEARLDGRLFDLPGGAARFAAGYERQETDVELNSIRGAAANPVTSIRPFSREVDSAYVELFLPMVGANNAGAGLNRLEFTVAMRYDDYSDVGSTTNPKFGFNWAPMASLKVRGSYGTSFRAPLISEVYGNSNGLFGQNYTNPAGGATLLGFAQSGPNLNLKPEEATTWSLGFDFTPTEKTNLSLSYFDVKYENQVNNYLSNLAILSLESEFAGTGVILRGAEAGAYVAQLYNNGQGLPLLRGAFPGGNPSNVTLYVDGRSRNLGKSTTRGVDIQALQRFDAANAGEFTLGLSAAYVLKYESAITPNGTQVNRLNTIFNPLRFKGRLSLGWENGPLAAQLALNYVNEYKNNVPASTQTVSDYRPVDLSVSLMGDELDWLGAFGKGFVVSFEVRNALDEEPPFVNIAQSGNGGGGFDPTVTNPVGRLFGLRMRKSWR